MSCAVLPKEVRRVMFQALGSYVELTNVSQDVFLGGLDTSGVDGKNTLIWHDDLLQVKYLPNEMANGSRTPTVFVYLRVHFKIGSHLPSTLYIFKYQGAVYLNSIVC